MMEKNGCGGNSEKGDGSRFPQSTELHQRHLLPLRRTPYGPRPLESRKSLKIVGIEFPKRLCTALRDGELVVFAGAGVSMGEPANLPNFQCLAGMIAEGTGQSLQNSEPVDRFLRKLKQYASNNAPAVPK